MFTNNVLSAPDYLCLKDGIIPDDSAYNELDTLQYADKTIRGIAPLSNTL